MQQVEVILSDGTVELHEVSSAWTDINGELVVHSVHAHPLDSWRARRYPRSEWVMYQVKADRTAS